LWKRWPGLDEITKAIPYYRVPNPWSNPFSLAIFLATGLLQGVIDVDQCTFDEAALIINLEA
jgi:hypothetical protein